MSGGPIEAGAIDQFGMLEDGKLHAAITVLPGAEASSLAALVTIFARIFNLPLRALVRGIDNPRWFSVNTAGRLTFA
jgi:hypothetical protein